MSESVRRRLTTIFCADVSSYTQLMEHDEAGTLERLRASRGINLGDIMVENDDIYGEGVNIAARLQQIAEPGGIMISRPVHDQVRTKLSLAFDFLGDQTVKNVAEPVPSYRILIDGAPAVSGATSAASTSASKSSEPVLAPDLWQRFKRLPALIKIAMVLVGFFFALNVASGLWPIWFHWPSIPMLAIILLYFSLRRPKNKAP